MKTTKLNSFLQSFRKGHSSKMRLFCFPYAGGGTSAYASWIHSFPDDLELIVIQLPGRESRIRETPFSNLDDLVQALPVALQPYLDLPYAFFGHSMGALVGFELCRAIRKLGWPLPIHLFLSGYQAPQIEASDPPIHELPDQQFLQELKYFGGISEEVFREQELVELMLPIIRKDIELCEKYTYSDAPPLECSISCYGGLRDRKVTKDQLAAWEVQTSSSFVLRMFDGNHFYLNTHYNTIIDLITNQLYKIQTNGK